MTTAELLANHQSRTAQITALQIFAVASPLAKNFGAGDLSWRLLTIGSPMKLAKSPRRPPAPLMDVLGFLIEKYEDEHVPELAE